MINLKLNICDALRDLVLFVQLKKRDEHSNLYVMFCTIWYDALRDLVPFVQF